MLTYPTIDPIAISIGPLDIHWYGLMYLLGFIAAWQLALLRSKRPWSPLRRDQVEDLIVYGAFGVILGGRFGYVIFYNFEKWLSDPFWLLRVWEGGMAFHGGLLGVIVAMLLYARKMGCPFLALTDFVAPLAPIGLGLGRVGNFIGQELWGRETESRWGMVFPADPLELVRHPSQLYQASLEGVLLFAILFWYSRRDRPRGSTSALFLIFYSVFRFLVEFTREPDSHIGFDLFGWMTRGQILCIPMLLVGLLLLFGSLWRHIRVSRRENQPVKIGDN